MKVIIAAPYLYNPDWPEFTRNNTGFGIMLWDIVDSVSKNINVNFISHVITRGHGEIISRHSWNDVLLNIRLRDLWAGLSNFFKYPQTVKNRARYVYYWVNKGFVRKKIRDYKPDVVHIHGIDKSLMPYIEVCDELKVPYIATLHGLIGLDDSVNAPKWDKDLERTFLIEADKKNIPVTVISTGIKKRIERNYLHHEAKNITVICNGTRIPCKPFENSQHLLDLRSAYHINENVKLVVAIGSICERKNQIQIVRAFASGLIKTPCHLFLCGTDSTNGEIQKLIDRSGLKSNISILGFVPQKLISVILDQVDLNIVASKDEGFGLSIIEAFSHGVPSVAFSDLDAIPDLFSNNSMVKVDGRSDQDLALAIEKALNGCWDSVEIKEHSKKFDLEKMGKTYIAHYYNVLQNHRSNHSKA